MLEIDRFSRIPIYEQLIEAVEREILSGLLKEGEQLPSVREMSLQLHTNPNTIQRAYQELDRRGIITSVPGVGNFVAPGALAKLKNTTSRSREQLRDLVGDMVKTDISLEELLKLVSQYYLESQDKKNPFSRPDDPDDPQ